MRITKVSVKKLFGIFDHEIPLNQDSRITIIHGPNGVGKTVMLRMVHGLFHYDYEFIGQTPFELFRIDFENGAFITVETSIFEEDTDEDSTLLIKFEDGKGEAYHPFRPLVPRREILIESIAGLRSDLELIDVPFEKEKTYWVAVDKGEVFTKERILREYPSLQSEVYGEKPSWFARIQKESRSTLISTKRLKLDSMEAEVYEALNTMKRDPKYKSFPSPPDAVSEFISNPLLELKDTNLEEYRIQLSELEVMRTELAEEIAEIKEALNAGTMITKHRISSLLRAHLHSLLLKQEELRQDKLGLVDFVIDDVLDAALFLDIINERFLFKTASLGGGEEFKITVSNGNEVPLSALSSGEQHLLVLYYQLLFEIQPNTLVMIDEPELSLHVTWQHEFLNDLKRVIELCNFDVLIATHSPQIVHDKYDWMVDLHNPEAEFPDDVAEYA